jgi:hypothetical protein
VIGFDVTEGLHRAWLFAFAAGGQTTTPPGSEINWRRLIIRLGCSDPEITSLSTW